MEGGSTIKGIDAGAYFPRRRRRRNANSRSHYGICEGNSYQFCSFKASRSLLFLCALAFLPHASAFRTTSPFATPMSRGSVRIDGANGAEGEGREAMMEEETLAARKAQEWLRIARSEGGRLNRRLPSARIRTSPSPSLPSFPLPGPGSLSPSSAYKDRMAGSKSRAVGGKATNGKSVGEHDKEVLERLRRRRYVECFSS
ncbi:hypothetical protein NGA_0207300, partial [Nannochloropsis gaditana CCMP526]